MSTLDSTMSSRGCSVPSNDTLAAADANDDKSISEDESEDLTSSYSKKKEIEPNSQTKKTPKQNASVPPSKWWESTNTIIEPQHSIPASYREAD